MVWECVDSVSHVQPHEAREEHKKLEAPHRPAVEVGGHFEPELPVHVLLHL
jgi:hypothetical protein